MDMVSQRAGVSVGAGGRASAAPGRAGRGRGGRAARAHGRGAPGVRRAQGRRRLQGRHTRVRGFYFFFLLEELSCVVSSCHATVWAIN